MCGGLRGDDCSGWVGGIVSTVCDADSLTGVGWDATATTVGICDMVLETGLVVTVSRKEEFGEHGFCQYEVEVEAE